MSNAAKILNAAREACKAVGSSMYEADGWRARGHGPAEPWRAVMLHDTVTPPSWSRPQLTRLLRDGYQGLPGPIANVQLERNGDAVLIAAGRAYHAGRGAWPGIGNGNAQTIGVEAANNGRPERWTDLQEAWAVAFVRASGLPTLGHKEWTSRKQDPWSVNMDAIRRLAAQPAPVPEDVMNEDQDARLKRVEEQVAGLGAAMAELSTIVADLHRSVGGRMVGNDLQRLRTSVRAIADDAGLKTEHPPVDGPVQA
jgi:hypothetical protein